MYQEKPFNFIVERLFLFLSHPRGVRRCVVPYKQRIGRCPQDRGCQQNPYGVSATTRKSADEYLQSPGITDDVRQNVGKLGLLVPGHYFQGHVYINIKDMTKVTGISTSDMLSSTLMHESTHMDNATDEGGVMAHLREALDNGEVDMDEALDIIEAVSGTDDYRRQARQRRMLMTLQRGICRAKTGTMPL